jgi:hypothetical protein
MLSCGHASLACPPPSCCSNTTPAVIHNPKHQHQRQQRQPCRMVSCSADASSTTSTSNTTPYSGASGSGMAVQQQQQELQQQEPQPSTSGRTAAASHAARSSDLATFQEMQEIATARGMTLTLKTLGPFYRITCRDGKQPHVSITVHCLTHSWHARGCIALLCVSRQQEVDITSHVGPTLPQ